MNMRIGKSSRSGFCQEAIITVEFKRMNSSPDSFLGLIHSDLVAQVAKHSGRHESRNSGPNDANAQ